MRITSLLGAALCLLLVAAQLPSGWPQPPDVTAEAFLLVDDTTGQVLASDDADRRRPVASTVKILTALTVLEHEDLDAIVTVGEEVQGLEGASVGLEPGDSWSVRDLLEGLLVRSGNDAAVALAVHTAGSVDAFVDLMAEHAAELGLDDVVLTTPSGLEDQNLLSARDLATLARVAMDEPAIAEIVGARQVELPSDPTAETRNELLARFAGATGVKTGYTERSGWSLVASAARDGRSLIAVVLAAAGPDQRFEDAAALLEHGFDAFVGVAPIEAVELRVGGGSYPVTIRAAELLVPASAPELELDWTLPVEVVEIPETVPVLWQGSQLADADVTTEPPAIPPAEGAASIARYLHDRAYAAMRAATAADVWNR